MNSNALEKLVEYYKEKKLSHAYLVSTNNIFKCKEVLLNVVKNIFCDHGFNINCNKCSLCHLIDINSLPSLKIIEPDGNFIKKEQILELKSMFSKNSQYTKENIYIILNCEKMNKDSANTMLKFLEEPEGNVIGFFITNHYDNVISTIQSRCQHISVNFNIDENEELNITKDKYEELSNIVYEYLKNIEVEKKESIIYNKKCLFGIERDDIKKIFQIILNIYKNELNNRILKKELEFKHNFLNNLTNKNLQKKINLIVEILTELNYNVNVDLILDRFVIEMEAINYESL